jgi:hypothetical protein
VLILPAGRSHRFQRPRSLLGSGGYPGPLEWPGGRSSPQFGSPLWMPTYDLSACAACCQAECTGCDPGTVPSQMQVDISGFSWSSGLGNCAPTAVCEQWNDTFILDRGESGTDCFWEFIVGAQACSFMANRVQVNIRFNVSTSQYQIAVALVRDSTGDVVRWIDNLGGDEEDRPDCTSFSGYPVPHSSGSMSPICAFDGSPALITSL